MWAKLLFVYLVLIVVKNVWARVILKAIQDINIQFKVLCYTLMTRLNVEMPPNATHNAQEIVACTTKLTVLKGEHTMHHTFKRPILSLHDTNGHCGRMRQRTGVRVINFCSAGTHVGIDCW